jgi:hypothetical protein
MKEERHLHGEKDADIDMLDVADELKPEGANHSLGLLDDGIIESVVEVLDFNWDTNLCSKEIKFSSPDPKAVYLKE